MTPELHALARRAVACVRWRWRPGMLTTGRIRITCVEDDGAYILGIPAGWHQQIRMEQGEAPDLTDPATLGCLLALVREAVEPQRAPGDWPMVCPYQSQGKKWGVGAWLNESGKATFAALVLPTYETEAAALVAALEAAP